MDQLDTKSTRQHHGEVLTAISDGMVALLKEFYGRGPSRAKSYYEDDLVVCLLRGGFSRVEQTLLAGGRGPSVIQQRMDFQDVMHERFESVIGCLARGAGELRAQLAQLTREAAGQDRKAAPGFGIEALVVDVEAGRVAFALPLIATPQTEEAIEPGE